MTKRRSTWFVSRKFRARDSQLPNSCSSFSTGSTLAHLRQTPHWKTVALDCCTWVYHCPCCFPTGHIQLRAVPLEGSSFFRVFLSLRFSEFSGGRRSLPKLSGHIYLYERTNRYSWLDFFLLHTSGNRLRVHHLLVALWSILLTIKNVGFSF